MEDDVTRVVTWHDYSCTLLFKILNQDFILI